VRFSKPNGLNQKKGISSIVGGIFFLVLMTSGFTVYYVALDSQSQMLDTQQVIADYEVAKIREKFVVAASSSGVNNLLSLQVVNTGNTVVEIADIWIVNKTAVTKNATKYDVDYRDASVPVGHSGNILANKPLYLISDIYDIKVISSLGTIHAVEYDVAGGSNILSAQMVAIPQDVRFGENVTIALIITNTGEFDVDQVQANLPLDVSPNQCENTPHLIFGGPSNLAPSQSTMFFWDCVLLEPIGNIITFTGNATGLLSGVPVDSNNAIDSVIVRDFSAGNFGDELILKDELFGKPELYMIISNVFGDISATDDGRGYWGVSIANPTNKTMIVNKVSISAIRGNSNDNVSVFATGVCNPGGGNPDLVMISPTTGWSCPNDNVLSWKSIAGITIDRQSAFPFVVELRPGTVSGNGLETVIVSASTFTSLGAFGKGPYETSMNKATREEAIVNVYMQDAASGGNILGVIPNVLSQQQVLFNATIAEFSDDAQAVDQVSQLIINIPKEWTYDSIFATSGFASVTPNVFADGSTQLVGDLSANLDNSEAVIQFYATAPGNTGSTNAKMYVFHVLGTGITTGVDTYLIGPIAETVVQICPVSGGPIGCP